MDTFTADEIDRNDRVLLPGDDMPYLVDRAWTATDGMVYVQLSSGDEEQFYRDDIFQQHPITGTISRVTNHA